VHVARRDDRTLIVRPVDGFHPEPDTASMPINLSRRLDYFVRAPQYEMPLGYRVDLPGMSTVVTALGRDGRPAEAMFQFDVSLDDPSLRWFRLNKGEYVPFAPPAVGDAVDVALE
jgi:hypothetical protein